MPPKDELITEVRAGLDRVYREYMAGDDEWTLPEWTQRVKTALCEACRAWNDDCWIYASSVPEDSPVSGSEWVFDVTCLLYDSDGYQRRIVLAAEGEWSRNEHELWRDFEKLLVSRADVRVMVFDGAYWGTNNPDFATYITRAEQTQPGDTYLLAGYTNDGFEYVRIDAHQSRLSSNRTAAHLPHPTGRTGVTLRHNSQHLGKTLECA